MKIIVPIKQILDPRGITVRRDKERIFINREDYLIGPGSRAALEAALRLKDDGDARVIAICAGEPQAEDALREALALGCDEAYLLSDPSFKDADISATTRILAAATMKLEGADLVLAGRESGDTGAGQIGPRLGEALGYAQVTDAHTLAVEGGKLRATRRWQGAFATVETTLPALVTVAPEAFPPRYPHGAGIMNAYRRWDVPTWTAKDLELDEAAFVPVLTFRGESFAPPLEVAERFEGKPEDVAAEVIMALRSQKIIDPPGGRHGL